MTVLGREAWQKISEANPGSPVTGGPDPRDVLARVGKLSGKHGDIHVNVCGLFDDSRDAYAIPTPDEVREIKASIRLANGSTLVLTVKTDGPLVAFENMLNASIAFLGR